MCAVKKEKWRVTRGHSLGLVVLLVSGTTAVLAADRCSALVGTPVVNGVVTSAKALGAGQDKASAAMCRAQLRLQPAPGSDIRAEIWLPDAGWNGKLISFGGGGFSGGVAQSETLMNDSVARGYATTTSDIGHPVSGTAQWAHGQPDKVIDFGHRANHVIAVAAKQLLPLYYKAPVQHAYFQGCSGGGREALMEASRYPEDYDGIIAGSPAMNFSEIMTQMIWNDQVLATAPRLFDKLPTVNKAVMKACDRMDGVEDGVLENPRQCRFDPGVLACKAFDTAACLNKAEVAALRKLYDGPRLANGELLIAGPPLGSEGAGWVLSSLMTGIGGPEFYRWMVHDDPKWTASSFDLERDYPLAHQRISPIVDSSNADLAAFARRGNKLILYHGWSDTLISAHNTVRYYEKARQSLGDSPDNSTRLFMVPGFQHCAAGVDMLPALEDWVERGKPPQSALAKGKKKGPLPLMRESDTSRLLCPWPQTARYKGAGATDDANSFTCR